MGIIDQKTALTIAQLIGYTTSKFVGIKVVSEVKRTPMRILYLLFLLGVAEASWVLFAVLPDNLKVIATFTSGLPLGMVWGLLVTYMEGRSSTDFILAVSSWFVYANCLVLLSLPLE